MAGITLAQAESHLSTWLTAEEAVASGQSYSHNGRALTMADLGQIREQIDFWDRRVKRLSRGGASVSRVVLHG